MTWIIIVGVFIFVIVLISFLNTMLKINAFKKANSIITDIAMKGEKIIISPEWGSFRGATKRFGRVKCDGLIVLTDKKIIFEKLTGGSINLNLNEVSSVDEEKTFLGEIRAGFSHLVIQLNDTTRIGFYVKDMQKWKDALINAIKKK